jgi:capsular exopolysaccharide synthesis family protein
MSRIHEALKKAAQERSAQLAAEVERQVVEAPVEVQVRRPATPERTLATFLERPDNPPVAEQTGPIEYQELFKRCSRHDWKPGARGSVFHGASAELAGAERFRTLRSRLYQIAGTRMLKRLLITSSVAAEGKTFVASNLAQSIAQQSERRVLLIDADLRAPRLHSALGAPRRPGLTDYLTGKISEYAAIQRGALENLFLIAAGNEASGPGELLLHDRMKQLLDGLTPIFDWIIIDSPPAMPVHDASILADMTDGVLLVVRAGSTEVEVVEKTAAEFREKNLLGVVLNQVDKADSYSSYYYPADAGEISGIA